MNIALSETSGRGDTRRRAGMSGAAWGLLAAVTVVCLAWLAQTSFTVEGRDITEGMINAALRKGERFYDPKNKSVNYILSNGFASGKNLLVGQNPITGKITTVIRATRPFNTRRMIKLP